MDRWFTNYENLVKGKFIHQPNSVAQSLDYWQDKLFINFLVYCLPVSLIAVLPGVYMAIQDGYLSIALTDIFSLLALVVVTFANKLSFIIRKLLIVGIFYMLAIVLINGLGYVGPGVFYLFAITVLIALTCPIVFAYWSVAANTVVLAFFTIVIKYQLFNCALNADYTAGKWVAFSSNLVFLSIVLVVLIQRIFDSLQLTIANKDQLQERYKNIFDRSPLPMWLFDTETLKFLDVNEATIRHYGYTKPEFLLMTIKDIRPAESVQNVERIVKENKITGKHYEGVSEHITKKGECIYVTIESSLLDIDGKPARLVLATDITQQLENQVGIFNANKKIKESESNLRAIFDNAIDGFVLLDASDRIKVFNAKAKEYIKFSKQEIEFKVGRKVFDYVEKQRHAYFKAIIERVKNGEVIEYDRKHSKGNFTYWIRYTLTPVYEDSAVNGVCITGRDVTVRKTYLKAVEDQNKTFREISWMQSHLVRAPLARIMGLTELLKQCESKNEQEEMLKYLSTSSAELDDVIKQITTKSTEIIEKYSSE